MANQAGGQVGLEGKVCQVLGSGLLGSPGLDRDISAVQVLPRMPEAALAWISHLSHSPGGPRDFPVTSQRHGLPTCQPSPLATFSIVKGTYRLLAPPRVALNSCLSFSSMFLP